MAACVCVAEVELVCGCVRAGERESVCVGGVRGCDGWVGGLRGVWWALWGRGMVGTRRLCGAVLGVAAR